LEERIGSGRSEEVVSCSIWKIGRFVGDKDSGSGVGSSSGEEFYISRIVPDDTGDIGNPGICTSGSGNIEFHTSGVVSIYSGFVGGRGSVGGGDGGFESGVQNEGGGSTLKRLGFLENRSNLELSSVGGGGVGVFSSGDGISGRAVGSYRLGDGISKNSEIGVGDTSDGSCGNGTSGGFGFGDWVGSFFCLKHIESIT